MDWDSILEKMLPFGSHADGIIEFIYKYKWYIIGGVALLIYVMVQGML